MDMSKLQELRKKMDEMFVDGSDEKDILKISVEIDRLIETYMEEKYLVKM